MNEDKIISLYQEFLEGMQRIQNSGQQITPEQQKKLAGFQKITTELFQLAQEKGFGDRMTRDINATVDGSDDLKQIIDAATVSPTLRNALHQSLQKWISSGKKIIRQSVWETVSTLGKHYQSNVVDATAIAMPSRMKGKWQKIFGQTINDLDLLAIAYQEAEKAALLIEITQLNQNNWVASSQRISSNFEKKLKNKKTWLLAADATDNAKTQLKIDLSEFALRGFKDSFLSLENGKIQLSGKLGFTKPVLASAQHKVWTEYVSVFSQGIRNTISTNIKDIFSKDNPLFSKGSTTAGSVGGTLTFDFLTITLKLDMGKTSWSAAMEEIKKGNLGNMPSGCALRMSIKVDIGKILRTMGLLDKGLNGTILNSSLCDLAVSGGWDLVVDWAELARIEMGKNKPKPKPKSSVDAEDLLKKDKALKDKALKASDEMTAHFDEVTDGLKQQNKQKTKKAAQAIKDKVGKIQNYLDEMTEKSRKAVKKIIEEKAEKAAKGVVGQLSKLTKLFKYAKPFARLAPGVNVLLTFYEIATYTIAFIEWLDSVEANTWEDYFIAIGSYMEKYAGFID
jgi:uncharacterized protein YbjQ (UPF0145 family)